ncbi:uncharacterized isoform X2 [Oryza sativa Japonica Group]|uniref:uncharacterized isoform X2 n=1 Tax=Oryza sativa subsp. japonica TaxID=39947 RepID=UPI000E1BD02F|nr:uncharacterized protein LOC4328648 isoform X2 [Oryza sativa Japonica Group]
MAISGTRECLVVSYQCSLQTADSRRFRIIKLITQNSERFPPSRNCFGCAKPTPIIAVDEPSKGLRIQGRSIKQRSLSEDFWSSSPPGMENSAMQSQRSMSSISTAAQSSDQHGAGSSTNPNEFVNQGLLLWNQTRQQWVGNRRHNSQRQQPREPKISWNATYESLLGSTKPFPQAIPLGEMVDFLVDGWEQEGLYD